MTAMTANNPPQILTDKDFVPDCHRIMADIISTKDGKKEKKTIDYSSWEIDGKRIRMAELCCQMNDLVLRKKY